MSGSSRFDDGGVGDERQQPFFWITPASVRLIRQQRRDDDAGLSQIIAVYATLAELANSARTRTILGGDSEVFTVERRKIAAYAGTSVKTVDRVGAALERMGLLRIERTRRQGDRNLPNRFVLIEGEGDLQSPSEDSGSPRVGDSQSHNNVRKNTLQEPPSSPPSAVDQVWNHYVTVMGKRGKAAQLRDDERKIIRAALAAAELEEVKTCITACEHSDYHMKRGKYDRREGQRYNSLGKILRPRPRFGETQRSRIEWWIEISGEQAQGGNFDPNTYAAQMRREQGLDP